MALPLKDLPRGASPGFGRPGYLSRGVENPGLELAYTEFTSDVTIAATVEASATTIVTAASLDLDGQAINVEFYCPRLDVPDAADDVLLTLWDGSTDLGRIGWAIMTGGDLSVPVKCERKITPTVGQHTYSIRGWHVGATNATAKAGSGGTGSLLPGFIRISRAYTQRED